MQVEEIRRAVVVGGGVMGSGIALVCARTLPVDLVDVSPQALNLSMTRARSYVAAMVENEVWTEDQGQEALGRINLTTDMAAALKGASLVMEAVPENMDLKKDVFRRMDSLAPSGTVLATNTSSFRIGEIASATNRPRKVIGIHWINPPYIMPIVEIVRPDGASQETLDLAVGFIRRLGWTPVVSKDVPGFIINRFQHALVNIALSLVEDGVASIEDIDTACRLSFALRLPMYGPLKSHDLAVNKKTSLATQEYIYRETGHPIYRPSPLLRQKVEAGELGILTGKGWYDYSGQSLEELQKTRDRQIIQMLRFLESIGLR
ncbi:MAG: 3-hydroxyacyl-CoA dehydrogenase family protein [Dehalococcoidia bacterium]|nr:3-hydroxyacyl-CoA dehydrogenase family protein [Dehalococcoidia bacterium]